MRAAAVDGQLDRPKHNKQPPARTPMHLEAETDGTTFKKPWNIVLLDAISLKVLSMQSIAAEKAFKIFV